MHRPYEPVAKRVDGSGDRQQRMRSVVDALWDASRVELEARDADILGS